MPCLPHLIHSKTVLLHSQSGVPLLQLQDPFLTTGLFSATSSSKLGKIWLLRPPRLGGGLHEAAFWLIYPRRHGPTTVPVVPRAAQGLLPAMRGLPVLPVCPFTAPTPHFSCPTFDPGGESGISSALRFSHCSLGWSTAIPIQGREEKKKVLFDHPF